MSGGGKDVASASSAADAGAPLSWTSWSGSTWERVLQGVGAAPARRPRGAVVPMEALAEDVSRAKARLATAMLRAGMVGGALKGGLNVFALLSRARARGGLSRAALGDAARDTAGFAAFLVAYAGAYVSVDESLALVHGKSRTKGWRAALAGALAAPSLLLADATPRRAVHPAPRALAPAAGPRHSSLATYVWLRSLVLLARCALKRRDALPRDSLARFLLAPFASDHADVASMCASATVILSCFILKPDAIRGAYAKFLDVHGGKTVAHYRAVGAMCRARTGAETADVLRSAASDLYANDARAGREIAALIALNETRAGSREASATGGSSNPKRGGARLFRAALHPGVGAAEHFVRFLFASLPRSFAVNLPIYLVPAVVLHRRRLAESSAFGVGVARRALLGAARSSAFLSAYCAVAWLGPELLAALTGSLAPWHIVLGVPFAGLASLIEKPSRRRELGVYCASRAVEAAALVAAGDAARGGSSSGGSHVVARWRFDVALFALASAVIMRCYAEERDVFRSKYLNVLDFVFGNAGHDAHAVRHVGSAYQIVAGGADQGETPEGLRGGGEGEGGGRGAKEREERKGEAKARG